MVDTSQARRLMDEARVAGEEGRRLIRASIELGEQAFAALPVGAVLTWHPELPTPFPVRVTLQADGTWDGATREWVEEQWMRGNLVLPPDIEEERS